MQCEMRRYLINISSVMDPSTILNLAGLAIGATGRVVALPKGIPAMTRLRELGLLPGTKIQLIRKAPLGDPLEISIRGSLLSLRKSEAEQIEIESV